MRRTALWILAVSIPLLWMGCTARPRDPLGEAAARGDLNEIRRLLNCASAEASEGALVWAARFGQPEAIYLLVRNGADPNGTSGVNDWSVLMHAIHKDQPQSVKALLNCNVQVNAPGRNGETALMMAAGYGYTDIVRMLLDHGANAHAALPNGENVLDFATAGVTDIDRFTFGRCQTETVQLLRERVPDLQPKNRGKLKSCS